MTTRERTTTTTVTTCGFIRCTTRRDMLVRNGKDGGARTIGAMTHGTRSGYNNGCRCRSCTTENTYLRCPGRAVTCRRGGCREPALDDTVRLCEQHMAEYSTEATRTLARVGKANAILPKLHLTARP